MKTGKTAHPLTNPGHPMLNNIMVIGVVVLVFTLLFAMFYKRPSSQRVSETSSTSLPTFPTVLTATSTPNMKTFTSPDLGIVFNYNGSVLWDNKPVQVKQIGNRIYLYAWDTKPKDGRFVEVFPKNPEDSLSEAIKKRFLQGYSEQDCQVAPANLAKIYYARSGFVYAQIQPTEPYNGTANEFQRAAKCPPIYTRINSLSYFLMDTAHPGKFLFFNIGQDTIDSGRTDALITWDQTIKFLDGN